MSGDYMGIEQLLAQDSETDYSDSEDDCGGDSDASDVARAVDARAADESFGRLDRANAELKAYLKALREDAAFPVHCGGGLSPVPEGPGGGTAPGASSPQRDPSTQPPPCPPVAAGSAAPVAPPPATAPAPGFAGTSTTATGAEPAHPAVVGAGAAAGGGGSAAAAGAAPGAVPGAAPGAPPPSTSNGLNMEPDPLYDETLDDEDEEWVQARSTAHLAARAAAPPQAAAPGLAAAGIKLKTDAVLSCPFCFAVLTYQCQQHVKYRHQFRAVFVENVVVSMAERLVFAAPGGGDAATGRRGKRKNRKRGDDAGGRQTFVPPSGPVGADEEVFHPVRCAVCATDVGVVDEDEVYHFVDVAPSNLNA